jgi:hypothetical protein
MIHANDELWREVVMFGSVQVPGLDTVTGAFALSLLSAGAALALLVVFAAFAFRYAGQSGMSSVLWRGVLVLVGAMLAWVLLDTASIREHAAERRAVEARALELTARAIAPGSALACLDAVATPAVESACEAALFAKPEAVAAAIAYIDARLSLLAAASAVATRDPGYAPALERLRRTLEADPFGLVAHVLTTRGCNAADCVDLKLLPDSRRILANMKSRSFNAHVEARAAAWRPEGLAVAPAATLSPGIRPSATTADVTPGAPAASKYDFPTAASIPPVSIMSPEPTTPASAEPRREPQGEPRAAAAPRSAPQPARRQTPREPGLPAPPLSVAPQFAAPPPAQSAGSR